MKPVILFSDNGVITDVSKSLENYHSLTSTIPEVYNQDNIFIGSRLPFNHIYFKVSTPIGGIAWQLRCEASAHRRLRARRQNLGSVPLNNGWNLKQVVGLWDGNTWRPVAQLFDETVTSGKTMSQSGYISWVPDRYKTWQRWDTVNSSGANLVTGISGINIYDQFWLKLSWSVSLTAGTALAWAGHLFSNDSDLGVEYPDLMLQSTLDAFSGSANSKTSWEEQAVVAAEMITKDLKKTKTVIDSEQVLDRLDLRLASVSKVASIIYNSFGSSHRELKVEAEKDYNDRFAAVTTKIDDNQNALLDLEEQAPKSFVMTR